ncbi:MAG: DUF2065 family protein [Deltaproteobacteria bacterium]|nr:DUF2065 family protein [Deltaproteobacteria bacterium]MBW2641212.1 DUF2065 family protein [Deltaproteobacteria bacterium]MBW2681542.1 DUF2065 family protein [Deltaproteobacteria bacterium]
MKWFLYAISFLWITAGSLSIIYTTESRNVMKRLFEKTDRKILSVFPAIIGILLFISASWSLHSWFLRILGIMAVIKGVIIFINPKNLYDEMMNWYLNSLSDQTYRFFGIVMIIIGTAVLSWIS